jgi:membrane protein required for colicin V production
MTAFVANLVTIGPFDLNGFDVVVLIILIISLLYAASRGLVREVISILALLIAAIATLFVWGQYRFAAQDFISPAWLADAALLVGVGAISYLIMVLIFSKIGKTIAGREVGFLDRILGAAFGVARGLIIAALFVLVLTSGNRAANEARAYKEDLERQGVYDQVAKSMPKSMRDQMEAEPKELPEMLTNSTFFPLLDRIGDGLRALPFAKMKTYADRIKDGDIDGLSEDILDGRPDNSTPQ